MCHKVYQLKRGVCDLKTTLEMGGVVTMCLWFVPSANLQAAMLGSAVLQAFLCTEIFSVWRLCLQLGSIRQIFTKGTGRNKSAG